MVVLNERLGVALSWLDVLIPLSLLGFAFERNADSTVTVWILAPLVRAQICHASFKHTYIWRVDRCFAGQPECVVSPTHGFGANGSGLGAARLCFRASANNPAMAQGLLVSVSDRPRVPSFCGISSPH